MTALLSCWAAFALLSTYGTYLYRRNVARRLDAPPAAGVAVVIPIRCAPGGEAAMERLLADCLAQRGVGHRLIVAVEDEADPAAAVVRRAASADRRVSLVLAGRATVRGQKVHNQLAALAALREEDRFVAFLDADVLLAPDWLSQLLRPITLGRAELASGYRWILPDDDRLPSRLCALMDWGIATAGRSRRWNLCWGGSMAISRAALDRIDLPAAWDRSLLDDVVLTRTARRAGIRVHAPHHALVPSPVRHDVASLFAFGRRQHLLVRVHAPAHWWVLGAALCVPALAGAAALAAAAQGSLPALLCLAAAGGLQQLRAQLRVGVARRVLAPGPAARSAALLRRDRWLLPAAHLAHTAIWLASAAGRVTDWGGRRYRLTGFARVEVVGPSPGAGTGGAGA